jgi:c-di-GMP-binding flagellar brake protein YcgR
MTKRRAAGWFMERRLYPPIDISLEFEYQAQLQDSEDSFSNRAVMKNFSMGGLHMSETSPILQPDDIADFIFKFQPDKVHPLIPHTIKAKGKVMRIEQPTTESSYFRIALEFLSGPFFVYAD